MTLVLLVFALVFFALAAAGVPSGRIQFGWLGAAALALSMLLHA